MALICDTSGVYALYDADDAERLRIYRLLSQDQRHFRAVQPRGFDHFHLLPADGE